MCVHQRETDQVNVELMGVNGAGSFRFFKKYSLEFHSTNVSSRKLKRSDILAMS